MSFLKITIITKEQHKPVLIPIDSISQINESGIFTERFTWYFSSIKESYQEIEKMLADNFLLISKERESLWCMKEELLDIFTRLANK